MMPRAADALVARLRAPVPAPSPKRGAHWRKNFALPASIRPTSTPAFSSDTRLDSIMPRSPRPAPARLTPRERAAIAALAARRLKREPVARIVGRKEFWSLPLRVDAATLVPRPETETVVEAALAAIDSHGPRAGVGRIADLGTGSGALLAGAAHRAAQRDRDRHRYQPRQRLRSRATTRGGWDFPARNLSPAIWRRRSADHST